jgi:hypothetical protein
VRSEGGEHALHQLLGLTAGAEALERCAWVASIELAAVNAGVHAPEPVFVPGSGAATVVLPDNPGTFIVHEWYDASSLDDAGISGAFSSSLGDALARVHTLDHPPTTAPDVLERRPTASDWSAIASRAEAVGLNWGSPVRAASSHLEAALRQLDQWDSRSMAAKVSGHRDLTSANLLNDDGVAVLIDWESAGPISTSSEIGRTALDNFLSGDTLDQGLLVSYLDGYAGRALIPRIDLDWCTLWIRGLVLFAEQCAWSLLAGSAPASLLDFQRQVIESTPEELDRRLRLAPTLVEQFRAARPS